jgi:predicted RNase H-like HicB family nuclease
MRASRHQFVGPLTDKTAPVTLEPMEYTVVVHKSKHGYDIHCPALPGCHSQGATEKEALANIKDAIKTYLAMVRKETRGQRTRRVLIPA